MGLPPRKCGSGALDSFCHICVTTSHQPPTPCKGGRNIYPVLTGSYTLAAPVRKDNDLNYNIMLKLRARGCCGIFLFKGHPPFTEVQGGPDSRVQTSEKTLVILKGVGVCVLP